MRKCKGLGMAIPMKLLFQMLGKDFRQKLMKYK